MNAVAKQDDAGYFIDGMSNEEYHGMRDVLSASTLKDFSKDPALLKWSRSAPQDDTKMAAIDFGTDFHSYFLEPKEFAKSYKVLPEFNRRKADEKKAEQVLIAKWKEEGITPVTDDDMKKLKAMRDSAMAHPTIAAIMKLGGIAERSYFWTDPMTGVACKCRPDLIVLDINDDNRPAFMASDETTLVMDLKTIANIDRIQNQIEELKYFVQDAFYTRGIQQVTGTKVCFVFAFVSTSLSLGRYPVQVVRLSDTAKFDGKNAVIETLGSYSKMLSDKSDSSWQTVIELDRPMWATREEDIY